MVLQQLDSSTARILLLPTSLEAEGKLLTLGVILLMDPTYHPRDGTFLPLKAWLA